ncbi:hypothetical protein LZF95_00055 [Algoriphagus sp. AGSA1]|uniref:TlpA family protein disulfide reductase n=1 Tax=Algoriphagus sp. AGSA1 TaxID=2907213 RepID=UPI001F1A5159|nr:hypothetical protein [Algoriphagus sp. AGSA1]MCE7053046.1 hypothetical protein [Algoriphagus sp. AGSA1]
MKKNILICLVGLLCLPTSTLLAQVADSPGADFLHRSRPTVPHGLRDTHRGGETRSDTLPDDVSLVDHSGQGQESEGSSAQSEGLLYLEIASPNLPDTLWLTYWEHMLSDDPEVTPGITLPLIGQKGTFFEGSAVTKVFLWELSQDVEHGYLSIANGKEELAKHWSFSAGDRVRIRVDLNRGNILFGGPSADFYRTQYLLDQAFSEEQFNSDPILIASRSEGLFADSASSAAYRKAHSQPEDLHVRIKVLVPKENGWDHLAAYLKTPALEHPAWKVLNSQRQLLSAEEYAVLEARITGEVLTTADKRAEMIAELLSKESEKGDDFLAWASGLELHDTSTSHPRLIQGLTRLEVIRAKLTGENVMDNFLSYSPHIRDELIGYYLLSNHNRLNEQQAQLFRWGISRVETPWIREKLESLREIKSGLFVSDGLVDPQGVAVDLTDFEGKTILIHYWISGCKFCIDDYRAILRPLEDLLENNPDILLVTINADSGRDSWVKSLSTGDYTSDRFLNLKAERGGPVLSRYSIHSFPQKMIIGPESNVRMQSLDRIAPEKLEVILDSIQSASPLSHLSTKTLLP